ncbi:MAG TPA: hypothetical protein PLA13_01155 [Microbacteriaceae bacterium]|nr:hypothetical protein [Microbacteriaceae bacterium]HQX34942.1 hypothetical protein [Microbacteriaceae bacterium]HQZ47361.1 hypothetical protein [Microbacteriaceae bacterium]
MAIKASLTIGKTPKAAPTTSPPPLPPLPPGGDVLELRVHGVNNTTAYDLLDLRPSEVELVAGDKLGSFWRPTAASAQTHTPGQRGFVPPGITREAYSWGGMVRTTPNVGDAGPLSIIAGGVARIFYALLLPFGIANAVQWTWRLPEASIEERHRFFAGSTRVFGLLLTLLFVCTAASLSLDLLALQCLPDTARCAPIAPLLEPFARTNEGTRLALFSLGPALAVGALWMLSYVSRLRYDVLPGIATDPAGDVQGADGVADMLTARRTAPAGPALLAAPGFWSNRQSRNLAAIHLAAGLLLTSAFTSGHAVIAWHSNCDGVGRVFTSGCLAPAFASGDWTFWLFGVLWALSVLGLILSVIAVYRTRTMGIEPEEAASTFEGVRRLMHLSSAWLLTPACVIFVVGLGALGVLGPSGPGAPTRMVGAGLMPLVIVVLLGAIAVGGLFWRGSGRVRESAARSSADVHGDRRHTAWGGCAPAVLMVLALAVAVGASCIVVVTVGDWLNGAASAAQLASDLPGLSVSSTYLALGTTLILGIVIGTLIALVWLIAVRTTRHRAIAWRAPVAPDPREPAPADSRPIAPVAHGVLPVSPIVLTNRVLAKRASAARIHLAEAGVRVVAFGLAAGLLAGIVWGVYGHVADDALLRQVPWIGTVLVAALITLAAPLLAVLGIVLVAVLVSGTMGRGERPLGIVWDIACYLPRTGHPFGPPCYAERAVPEIAGRLFEWLSASPTRSAVLAAHSMGGVLAVSSLGILASHPETASALSRVSLLTFGVQFRAFFGRIFPELLGSEVLGNRPSLGPTLGALPWRTPDPWLRDFDAELASAKQGVPGLFADAPAAASATHTGRLTGTLLHHGTAGSGVRWVSLWRLSDYLGFPAVSTVPNPVDRFAEEVDPSGYMVDIATHNTYYRTPSYREALIELGGV